MRRFNLSIPKYLYGLLEPRITHFKHYYERLVKERRNSIANAMELRLSCTNPPIIPYNLQSAWSHYTTKCQPSLLHCIQVCRVCAHRGGPSGTAGNQVKHQSVCECFKSMIPVNTLPDACVTLHDASNHRQCGCLFEGLVGQTTKRRIVKASHYDVVWAHVQGVGQRYQMVHVWIKIISLAKASIYEDGQWRRISGLSWAAVWFT